VWDLLAQLIPESSTYDSYILFERTSGVLWYFLCSVLGGLFAVLFLNHPKKEGA